MAEIVFKLNSPLTKDDWNLITDAEFEHSDGVTYTTPSGKEVEFRKVVHGEWVANKDGSFSCSVCKFNFYPLSFEYCPHCGAKMDGGRDDKQRSD